MARPFFNYQCYSKVTVYFIFFGACSLVATTGHGSEGLNVAPWDTLLLQNKFLVRGFMRHEQGTNLLILAQQHQLLISDGRKDNITIFDVQQRQQRHRFQAHKLDIKYLVFDLHEEFLVSEIWGLTVHSPFYSFPAKHPWSNLFKNIEQDFTQLYMDSTGRLFLCGADGSMKVRQLSERDCIVQALLELTKISNEREMNTM